MHSGICSRSNARVEYRKYLEMCKINDFESRIIDDIVYPPITLGNCTANTPNSPFKWGTDWSCEYKEEGNNPMYSTKTVAVPTQAAYASSITIQAPEGESDAMKQRDYLLGELREITRNEWRESHKLAELRKLFNIDAPMAPRTSQEIIDAFTKNLVTIDQAKVDAQTKFLAADEDTQHDLWKEGIRDRYYGITFTALPVADRKGYMAAYAEWQKMVTLTERTIKIGSPADGLAAILALEAWMPTQNAPTTTTVQ